MLRNVLLSGIIALACSNCRWMAAGSIISEAMPYIFSNSGLAEDMVPRRSEILPAPGPEREKVW